MKKLSLGLTFAEQIEQRKGHSFGRRRDVAEINNSSQLSDASTQATFAEPVSHWRTTMTLVVIFSLATVIASRLTTLQLLYGATYRAKSEANRLVTKAIHAPRGIMYDRNLQPMVRNLPVFVRVASDSAEIVSYEEGIAIEATGSGTSRLEVQAVRDYPYKDVLAHVLGYTSEVSKEELAKPTLNQSYVLGDRIGRSGLELSYEAQLKGTDGKDFLEVNATAKTSRHVGTKEPLEGNSLVLALDAGLQQVSYDALKAELDSLHLSSGVVIAQNPKTGGVLSLASFPSYDNNLFSGKLSVNDYQALLQDPDHPLFNRVVSGVYPPGSLYKIVTSVAGLNSGKITSNTEIVDTGVITLGPYTFANWLWNSSHRTDGSLNLSRAIARSNDIFFYRAGEMIGPDVIAENARKLGLGKETGIDLPGEQLGTVPDTKWKERVIKEPWYPGDTYHVAIGQGYNLVTPLQLNMLTAFVANNGIAFVPHLVDRVISSDTSVKAKTIQEIKPQVLVSNVIEANKLNLIRQGMKMACEDGGTGWPFFDFGISQFESRGDATQSVEVKKRIEVGCKTGTAEFGNDKKTHAWFTIFAPYDNPEIAVTVLIEAGGEGSNVSAPVAKKILEWYFANH